MTRLESIYHDALALPKSEREELVRLLLSQLPATENDDAGVSDRGLAAWTESSQGEDWTEFYPAELVNGRKGKP